MHLIKVIKCHQVSASCAMKSKTCFIYFFEVYVCVFRGHINWRIKIASALFIIMFEDCIAKLFMKFCINTILRTIFNSKKYHVLETHTHGTLEYLSQFLKILYTRNDI